MPSYSASAQRKLRSLIPLLAWTALHCAASAQDLEPRRWAHMPVGTNVVGLSYVYTDGDLLFDPVLELEDVEVSSHRTVAAYARWFECWGKTARVDFIVPYRNAEWAGLLSGSPASTRRDGFSDPWIRLSYNFIGAPALQGKEYLDYRTTNKSSTIVGAALGVMLPLGEYKSERLINLGQNRFILRPQIGAVHTRGRWSYELTGSTFFFTKNDDFWGGNQLKKDPVFATQAHVLHSFPNRWWVSGSVGYSWGGIATVIGVRKDNESSYLLSALSLGFPIAKSQAFKLVFLRGHTQADVGIDSNNLVASWSYRF